MKLSKTDLTRMRIKDIAKDFFLELGFDQTTLSELAKEISVDRRTVYRYYLNKQELLLDLVTDIYGQFTKTLETHTFDNRGKALERIKELFTLYENFFRKHVDFLILIGMLDANLSNEIREREAYQSFIKYTAIPDIILESLLKEGVADCSVKKGTDPKLIALTINNSLLSLASRIVTYDENLTSEQDLDSLKLIESQLNMFMIAIRND